MNNEKLGKEFEMNSELYFKVIDNGKEEMYLKIRLNTGEIVDLPISMRFFNASLLYKIKKSL